ncbi:MAG TPA: TonB-dependent receptor plug domain-containing protein [Gammaproteobacteria bacterium]
MNAQFSQRSQAHARDNRYDGRSLETARVPLGTPRVRACALAVAAALVGGTVFAQESGPVEEVLVTGSRIATSGVNTPTPVTAVTADDLATMAPGTMVDALKQLPQFYNTITTQQAVGGAVAAGGSNVNLRGAGAERTLVLLDGRRLGPANKFGTVDIGIIPEALIRSVEAVTGGASAAYGADAVSGVVNFRLDSGFDGIKYSAQYGTTTYGDGDNYELSVAYGTDIGERGHIIASAEYFETDGIESLDSLLDRSDFYQQNALVTNPHPDGPTFLTRRFVAPTNFTAGGILLGPAVLDDDGNVVLPTSSLDHVEFLPDGSGAHRKLPFSGIGQLSGGCNCQALPTLEYGVDSDTQIDTPADRTSLFAHFDYDVSDRSTFFVETLLAENFTDPVWQTAALLGPWQSRVFADNPFLPDDIRATLEAEGRESIGFAIFTPNTPGNPFSGGRLQGKNRYGQFATGFSHDLSDDFLAGGWVLDSYVQYAQNKQDTIVPAGMRTDRLFLALDAVEGPDGDPVCRVTLFNPGIFDKCVPINLFGGVDAVTPEAAAYVTDQNGKIARGRTSEYDAEVTLTGDLTRGSDDGVLGPISAAFGLSWRQQDLRVRTIDPCDEFPCTVDNVRLSDLGLMSPELRGILPETDPNNGIPGLRHVPPGFAGDANSSTVLFSSQRSVEGGYSVREAFFEFRIPLFDGRLNLDEAYRMASYTGSGNEPAWKSGVSFQATPELRIRATRSQDVRAPTLRERFEQQRGGVNVRDPLHNNDTISTASFSGGNPNVGLETASTNTIGIVYEPLERFSMTLDWYDIDLDGAIGQLGAQDIVDTCFQSGGTASVCEFVVRDNENQIVRVDNLFINLSNQKLSGVDAELNFTGVDLAGGTLGWRLLATRLNENSILTPGSPRDDRAGDIGAGLPQNKVTTSLTYSRGPWSVFLQERYIDGGTMNRNFVEGVDVDDNTVSSVAYTDLTFKFSGRDGSAPWQFFFTANNLFDEAPPDTYSSIGRAGVGGPNSILYDTIGRRFVAGVRVNY